MSDDNDNDDDGDEDSNSGIFDKISCDLAEFLFSFTVLKAYVHGYEKV